MNKIPTLLYLLSRMELNKKKNETKKLKKIACKQIIDKMISLPLENNLESRVNGTEIM